MTPNPSTPTTCCRLCSSWFRKVNAKENICVDQFCVCHSTPSVDTPPAKNFFEKAIGGTLEILGSQYRVLTDTPPTYYQGGSSLRVKMDKQLDNDFTPPPTDTMEGRFDELFSDIARSSYWWRDAERMKQFARKEIALAVKNREEEIRVAICKLIDEVDLTTSDSLMRALGANQIGVYRDVLSLLTQK